MTRDARSGAPNKWMQGSAWLVVAALCLMLTAIHAAQAQIGSDRYSSIVIDARSGRVLSAVNPDEPRHPASLTKMMTLYMVFEALRDRRIGLDTPVPVSSHAASMIPSKLGLMPGTRLTVEQAILGLVTKSANDAASALGELLGGDETRFAEMMTLRGRALGMTGTQFRNASGVPDPDQISTARDMATLGRRLVADFPMQYRYFSTPEFRFHGRVIPNHDHLLQTYPGADGIKTGFVTASGFNMVTSAVRSDIRLIGVVLGAGGPGERDGHMMALLDQGFEMMNVAPMTASLHREILPRGGLMSQANAATALPPPAPPPPRQQMARWSVLVGSFTTESAARVAANAAHKFADGGQVRIEPGLSQGHAVWRAQLAGFSAAEASSACNVIGKHKLTCVVLRPDLHQVAGR
jgi:D-alanyl-D-alanine carboxypeptidase